MTPGVCTWCGCSLAETRAMSTRCGSCRRWLLADLDASSPGGPLVYFVPRLRVEATADRVAFRPRWTRWRVVGWHAPLFLWTVFGRHLEREIAPYLGILVGLASLAFVAGWAFDRPRVVVDGEAIRIRGGWRRPRVVVRGEVASIQADLNPAAEGNAVTARLRAGGDDVEIAVLPDSETARILAAHIRRVLGLASGVRTAVARVAS